MSARRTAVGVLVSGAGTNLEALLRATRDPAFSARVVQVLSNRRDSAALDIARRAGVPALAMPQSEFGGDTTARDRAMLERMRAANVEVIVCAGYDRLLSDEFLAAYPDAILNVHPSLLPAFAGGMNAVEDALAQGVKITGCTVQLLQPGDPDGGAIILQAAVAVEPGDDAETLRMRIHQQEWRLLPFAVELWATGRLRREGRRVHILETDGGPAAAGTPPRRRIGLPTASAPSPPRSRGAPPIASSGLPPAASPTSVSE